MKRLLQVGILCIVFIWGSGIDLSSAGLPPCGERATRLDLPRIDQAHFCLELVFHDESAVSGELGFTALATAPDGTLYTTRPLTGEVFALTDTTQDGLPDVAVPIINGLTTPNSVVYYANALYIAGGATLSRWQPDTGIETLVSDLPAGTGFWTGGLAFGDDERLYVGIGAACDVCPPDNGRGRIVSYALDGTDRQDIALGFRQPNGLSWHQGALWSTDTVRDGLDSGSLEELNRVTINSTAHHYGFPYCIGLDNTPDALFPEADCSETIAPTLTFPTHSTPIALAAYHGKAFPHLQGTLLVALSGAYNESRIRGYSIMAVDFDENGNPIDAKQLFPALLAPVEQYELFGIYPHRIYGLAISPEGWIYISVGGSRIYALRPV